MTPATKDFCRQIQDDGFALLDDVFNQIEIEEILGELDCSIENDLDGIKNSRGQTYAARNVSKNNPRLLECWKKPVLLELVHQVLGRKAGLVRILFFDKHPDRTWSLPWHKDVTIAVKDNQLPTHHFSKPTIKSGVPHVHASTEVLSDMLTLRIRLDEITQHNGPLQVARGSHKNGKAASTDNQAVTVLSSAGAVLAMRPLLSHASESSTAGCTDHRRILHLEFASSPLLPDEYQWFEFWPVSPQAT